MIPQIPRTERSRIGWTSKYMVGVGWTLISRTLNCCSIPTSVVWEPLLFYRHIFLQVRHLCGNLQLRNWWRLYEWCSMLSYMCLYLLDSAHNFLWSPRICKYLFWNASGESPIVGWFNVDYTSDNTLVGKCLLSMMLCSLTGKIFSSSYSWSGEEICI